MRESVRCFAVEVASVAEKGIPAEVLRVLSEEDLTLVHALQIAPRATWTDLGPILEAHPTTLAARWAKLRGAGLAWVTGTLVGTSMETSLSFIDIECGLGRRQEILTAVCQMPAVVSVEESARNRDLMLTVVAPSLYELGQEVVPELTSLDGITRYQISVCTALHAGANEWRLRSLTKAQEASLLALLPHESSPRTALPASHWRIVQELAKDGRASSAEIARRVGLNPSTASRQLNRVLNSNIMTFRCEMAQGHSGYPVSCQWFARVPPGAHAEVAQSLRSRMNVRFCASTTGATNFTMVLWLRSVQDVLDAELAIVKINPEIELVESTLTLKFDKRVGWMLRPDGSTTGVTTVPPLPRHIERTGLIV